MQTFPNVWYLHGMARPSGYKLSRFALDDISKLQGLSISDIAERSGIPRATISSLAGGHHKASMTIARRLAETLSVSPQSLFPELIPTEVAA